MMPDCFFGRAVRRGLRLAAALRVIFVLRFALTLVFDFDFTFVFAPAFERPALAFEADFLRAFFAIIASSQQKLRRS